MVLQASGTISIADIRTEFYNASAPNPTPYGTDLNNLSNLNFYRGRRHYVQASDSYAQFSTGTIQLSDFYSKRANCQCRCDCDCGDCP